MNKLRRKHIDNLMDRIAGLQDTMAELLEELEGIRDDEQEAFENIPESLEGSARYEAAEEAVEYLDSAYDDFESAKDGLDDVLSSLSSAME